VFTRTDRDSGTAARSDNGVKLIRTMNTTKQLAIFLGLTWLISWPLWILSGVLGRGSAATYDFQWWIAQLGVFAPSLSAVILSGFSSKVRRNNSLRLLLLFFCILAVGIQIASSASHSVEEFPLLTSGLVLTMALVSLIYFSPSNHFLLNPATGEPQRKGNTKWVLLATFGLPVAFFLCWLPAGNSGSGWSISSLDAGWPGFLELFILNFCRNLNYGGSMGEELGWRGYCLPLLLRNSTPLQASVILGFIQALWHLPIDLTSSNMPLFAVFSRLVWAIPVTFIFTWIYLRSPANLLTALLLHTSVNVLPDIGFSNYDGTMPVFVLIVIVLAIFVGRTPIMQAGNTTLAHSKVR